MISKRGEGIDLSPERGLYENHRNSYLHVGSIDASDAAEGGTQVSLAELVTEIRKAAMEMHMEVDEVMEWLKAENDKRLPWEE